MLTPGRELSAQKQYAKMELIKVGLLGLSQRIGRFNELGLRSWEESGCAEVERCLLSGNGEEIFFMHRPLVIRHDQKNLIRILRDWCDAPDAAARCDLILTVAGTGLAPYEKMPEATKAIIRYPLPRIADYVHSSGISAHHAETVLSRGTAGIRHSTLIINLPGTYQSLLKKIMDNLTPMLPVFVEAVRNGDFH